MDQENATPARLPEMPDPESPMGLRIALMLRKIRPIAVARRAGTSSTAVYRLLGGTLKSARIVRVINEMLEEAA